MEDHYFKTLKEFMALSNIYKTQLEKAAHLDKLADEQRKLLRQCRDKDMAHLHEMYNHIEHVANCVDEECNIQGPVTLAMEKMVAYYHDIIDEYDRMFKIYEEDCL